MPIILLHHSQIWIAICQFFLQLHTECTPAAKVQLCGSYSNGRANLKIEKEGCTLQITITQKRQMHRRIRRFRLINEWNLVGTNWSGCLCGVCHLSGVPKLFAFKIRNSRVERTDPRQQSEMIQKHTWLFCIWFGSQLERRLHARNYVVKSQLRYLKHQIAFIYSRLDPLRQISSHEEIYCRITFTSLFIQLTTNFTSNVSNFPNIANIIPEIPLRILILLYK